MDSKRHEQLRDLSPGDAREGERASRRVRPRAEIARAPHLGKEEETSPVEETTPPRLGLAFILNDAEPHHDSSSDVTIRPALLPQRRHVQWGSPTSYLDIAATRLRGERSIPTPLASPVWRVELHSALSGVTSHEFKRTTSPFEEKGESPGEYEENETHYRDDKNQREDASDVEEKADAQPAPPTTVPTSTLSREEKRRGRTCRVDGCDNYIVHKGLCCRHGGARKCTTEGCESTAKYMGLCWKHGGSTWCKIEGCSKRAKAKGRCWAHGGGTQCSHEGCTKVAVSNGLCWAYGGGKRCLFDGCNRPGYERTNGFCDRHFEEMQGVNYFEV